ncbi:MAG: Maf family protein, partial [Pseudomonadota bacterium]
MTDSQYKLVLASSSPFRRRLLEAAGFHALIISPNVDEDKVKNQGLRGQALAETLAEQKALAVLSDLDETLENAKIPLVIGSDQVAALGDQIFSKPGNEQKAVQTLGTLSG